MKHFDLTKKNGKLIIENLRCGCAHDHTIPDMDIYIRTGLLDTCAECIKDSGLGQNALLVADDTTYRLAGAKLQQNLINAGLNCRVCVLPGDNVEPTPEMADIIVSHVKDDVDFLISVGSGVVTDLTRYSAHMADKPFAVFGTAASMDGYTSITSSMMIGGMKISKYGKAARLIMFDPAVLATAPMLMQASGVGDLMAKYGVLVDWKLGSVAAGEVFCPLCGELLMMALDKCASHIDDILSRTEEGMEALIEALILAGLTVLIVKNTRPVASVEHNMAHYWDMMHVACGGSPVPSHGICVGIGFIYCLYLHEMLKNADLRRIDKERVRISRMTRQQKKDYICACYPPGAGEDIMEANEEWYIDWPENERRIDALAAYHEQYIKDAAILPEAEQVIKCFERFGMPTKASQAGISHERLRNALLCTKDFRRRYSVAQALSELGLLEECAFKLLERENSH